MYRKYNVIVYNSILGTYRTVYSISDSNDSARLKIERSLTSTNDHVVSVFPSVLMPEK